MLAALFPPIVVMSSAEAMDSNVKGLTFVSSQVILEPEGRADLRNAIREHLKLTNGNCSIPLNTYFKENHGFAFGKPAPNEDMLAVLEGRPVNPLLQNGNLLHLGSCVVECPVLLRYVDFAGEPITLQDFLAIQVLINHFVIDYEVHENWDVLEHKSETASFYYNVLQRLESIMVAQGLIDCVCVDKGDLPFATMALVRRGKAIKFKTENATTIKRTVEKFCTTDNVVPIFNKERKDEVTK